MKEENKIIITDILNDELGSCLPQYEITYTVSKMGESRFDLDAVIDKVKLETACTVASKYLNSITMPVTEIAMNAIYRNKILISMVKITKALVG